MMNYSLPNILSLLRVLIAPFIYQLIITNDSKYIQFALIVFSLGAITDYLDGYIARKWGNTSTFGSFLDPIADKILTNAALLAFMSLHLMDLWMIGIIIARDVFMTLLRVYADRVQMPIITSFLAKVKTTIQLIFTIIVLLSLSFNLQIHFLSVFDLFISSTSYIIIILSLLTTVEYVLQNKSLILKILKEPLLPSLHTLITTCFGIGYSPLAPGTFASLSALLILLFPITHGGIFIASVIGFIAAIPSITHIEKNHGNDASMIVIDEVVGMWLVLSYPHIPHTPIFIFASFLIFRFFDIVKPFPINLVNKKIGAIWVMADDIVAAIMTIIVVSFASLAIIGSNLLFMR